MTFDELIAEIVSLSKEIRDSGFQPDYLVGLARGGWIPTRLLSGTLGVSEILSIGMKYADMERTNLLAYSTPNPMPSGKSLLLIEDCLESGKSLLAARDILLSAGNTVKTASIFVTDKTLQLPDFYSKHVAVPPRFPWE